MIRAVRAKFLNSAPSIKEALEFTVNEIVFLGRSNVGKSSLINALANNNTLAKSSSTPGKTRLINFFEVWFKNDENEEQFNIIFVDLPGFGYARVAKSLHYGWEKNLDEFLRARKTIKLFIHLIDSRHFDLEIDKNLKEYLKSFIRDDQNILNLYTKSDKLNQSQRVALLKSNPNAIMVSILNKKGLQDTLNKIINNFGI